MTHADLTVYGVSASVLVYLLVEVARELKLPSRLAPIAAVVFGIALGLVAELQFAVPNWKEGASLGLVAGLASSGLQSGMKSRIQAVASALTANLETLQAPNYDASGLPIAGALVAVTGKPPETLPEASPEAPPEALKVVPDTTTKTITSNVSGTLAANPLP